MNIRNCTAEDAPKICDIYNYYVLHTVITFEENPVTVAEMEARIAANMRLYPWLVGELDGEVIGYAYASQWKERSAYRHTAEVTVYIKHDVTGAGYGTALYAALITQLQQQGCHVLLGCLAIPNQASARLHERFGFTQVAHFSEVGRKFNRWIDVGYWLKTM